jgi:hypothetical protein
MQQQPDPVIQGKPAFSIRELEQIESAIQASQTWLAALHQRRDALTSELERITRPQPARTKPARTIGPGLEYRGAMTTHWNYIDIHIDLLRRLWTEFPEQREAMARAVGKYGTTRAYVAKTRAELFPGQSPAFAQRYSRSLVDGWYVDTNLNKERMRRILPAAVAAAGLKWGTDVRAFWRATQVQL